MAITFVTHITEASNATPSTLTYPAASNGNLLAVVIASKPPSRTVTPPAGLFDGGNNLGSATGGVPPNGGDTGDLLMNFWARTVDGTEPATSPLTWTSAPSPAIQSVLEFGKSNAGAWSVASAFGADNAQSTGTAAVSSTAASDPGYQPGDLAVVAFATPTDAGTYANLSITIPGCTLGAVSQLVDYATTVGNDGRLHVWSATVTAGTSSAAPSFQCDVDTINASAGVLLFARLREPDGGTAPASDALVYNGTDWTNSKIQSYDGSGWT